MLSVKSIAVLTMSLALAGCATDYAPSRNITDTGLSVGAPKAVVEGGLTLQQTQYNVKRVNVLVPRTLRVSEANVFYPIADIVWHGDPLGDRYAQVASVLQEGLDAGTANLKTGRAVEVDVQLTRFHALTPKTRYTVGGVHDTEFLMTVKDAVTGEVLDGPRKVLAEAHASGGQRALEEEAAGITQRSVIEGRLAVVIQEALSHRLVPAGTPPVYAASTVVSRNAFTPADLPLVDWNGTLRAAN
jgi:hypothetical protein